MNDAVSGHCDHWFDKLADALADEIAKGEELGASISRTFTTGTSQPSTWHARNRGGRRERRPATTPSTTDI
jgi:hypothetical protein